VNEIIQPCIDPQIVEIQNIYDGDGIEFTTEELSLLNDSVVYLSDSHINDNPGEYVTVSAVAKLGFGIKVDKFKIIFFRN